VYVTVPIAELLLSVTLPELLEVGVQLALPEFEEHAYVTVPL